MSEIVRVAIISPSDVEDETAALVALFEQADALNDSVTYRVWNWLGEMVVGMHEDGVQGLTDEAMDIASADIVVAVFWSRLGTPIMAAPSGTVHELELAWDAWRRAAKPDVWVYFCERDIPQSSLQDGQYEALASLRENLPKEQAAATFLDAAELQELVTRQLSRWLEDRPVHTPAAVSDEVLSSFFPPDATNSIKVGRHLEFLRSEFEKWSVCCLYGLSGSGKTRMVANYFASDAKSSDHSGGALWYVASEGGTLDELFSQLPSELVGPDHLGASARSRSLLVALRLQGKVLVIDDFHEVDRQTFDPLLRAAATYSRPSVLVLLSQNASISVDVEDVPVPRWDVDDIRALVSGLGGPALAQGLVLQLINCTGGLPLAVRFFCVLVSKLGYSPQSLLSGELVGSHVADDWYRKIETRLSESELWLLRHLSLAEPYVTEPIRRRVLKSPSLSASEQVFARLLQLLLLEPRKGSRWVVHPFVAEHALRDIEGQLRNEMLLELSRFTRPTRAAIRHGLTPPQLVAGLRAGRYAQRAGESDLVASIIGELAPAAKRYGQYAALRTLCLNEIAQDKQIDPWIAYHYAHCELILGDAGSATAVLARLVLARDGSALYYAASRVLADARWDLGQTDAAIADLLDAMGVAPQQDRGAKSALRQAELVLARLLVANDEPDRGVELADKQAAGTSDPRTLGICWMIRGLAAARITPANGLTHFQNAAEAFNTAGDRRGLVWSQRMRVLSLIDSGLPSSRRESRKAARDVLFLSARLGESSREYLEWLDRVSKWFASDPGIASVIGTEKSRLGVLA